MRSLGILVIGGLLVFVVILISIFQLLSRPQTQVDNTVKVAPTSAPFFSSFFRDNTVSQNKQTQSNSVQKSDEHKEQGPLSRLQKSLGSTEQALLQDLTLSPVTTDDFQLKYSPSLDSFVYYKMTENGDAAFRDWIQSNNLANILQEPGVLNESLEQKEDVSPYKDDVDKASRYVTNLSPHLPYSGNTFRAQVSADKNRVEIKEFRTGDDTNKEIADWAFANGVQQEINNPSIFTITDPSGNPTVVPNQALEQAAQDSLVPTSSSTEQTSDGDTRISELNSQTREEIVGPMVDSLSTILDFLIQNNKVAESESSVNTQTGTTTQTSTQTTATQLPGTTSGNSTISSLVTGIRSVCASGGVVGRVNSGNVDCIERVEPPIDDLTRSVITRETNAQTHFQCVGFIYAAVAYTRGKSFYCPGNAKDFTGCQSGDYRYYAKASGRAIQTDDVLIWDGHSGNPYGHVAFVSKVIDENTVVVAEANADGQGLVQEREISLGADRILGWLSYK